MRGMSPDGQSPSGCESGRSPIHGSQRNSTQTLICIRWLISDSTYLRKSWMKSDSQSYSTHCSKKLLTGVRSDVFVDRFFPCNAINMHNIQYSRYFFRKNEWVTQHWLNQCSGDSTLTQVSMSVTTLTRLNSLNILTDSTLTRLSWVRIESNLTPDSWVKHNPGANIIAITSKLQMFCTKNKLAQKQHFLLWWRLEPKLLTWDQIWRQLSDEYLI